MATAFESDESSIVEFQLGNKQLFLLFLGLLVICAIFFFIGLRVGEDTAKAKIPVEIGGSDQAVTNNGAATEQTLDLQPLSKQKQNDSRVEQTDTPVESVQKPVEKQVEKPVTRQQPKPQTNNTQKASTETTTPARTGIFVQILSSPDRSKAQKTEASVGGNVSTQIQSAQIKGTTYYRVLVGPFKSRNAAGQYRQQILPKHKDAFLQIIR